MRRLLAAALSTAAVAAAGTVAVAAPAHAAAPAITGVKITPAVAVQSKVNKQKVTVEVRTSAGVDSVTAELQPRVGSGGIFVNLAKTSTPGLWRASDYLYNYDAAGAWTVDVEAADYEAGDNWETRRTGTWQVRKNTYFSGFQASPSPVRKGKAITVSGWLKGLDGYGYAYAGVRNQKIAIYFKKKGTAKWVPYGTVTTASGGKFSKRFQAKASGYWQAGFAGTGYWNKSWSGGDGVVVR
ncbi:hypothetical protein [Actinomadura hibisca]|uniref:hypothetical protein n=1 Tax=Actinomadura hibisca TaxID=68565 RepID=UPI0008379B78|nr:hypothetical protein [Actinomadura hibisca]